jgi:thiol-disulfide isomerase/thioredoxin
LDGERVSLKDYQGKVVFLAFWASWCSRCPEEIAFLKKLSARFSDDLVVLAVNQEGEELTDTQPDHLRAAMVETQIPFPVLLDPNLETWRAYCLNALPTTVILDREGKVRFAEASFYWASEEKITQALEGLGVLRPTASSSPEG